jgi:hypothetical protein
MHYTNKTISIPSIFPRQLPFQITKSKSKRSPPSSSILANPISKIKGVPHVIDIQTQNFANLTLSQDCHSQKDHQCAKNFWIERIREIKRKEKEKKNSTHINFI